MVTGKRTQPLEKQPDKFVSEESIAVYGVKCIKTYATEVNLDRAVPDLFDGLKPVQRRVLWAMSHIKKGEMVKTARHVGNCFAKGTRVILYPGYSLPIEEVEVGQLAYTDEGLYPVTKLFKNENCTLYRVKLENGVFVDATPDQVFYCLNNSTGDDIEYERTPKTLKPGDHIRSAAFRSCVVKSVEKLPSTHTTYDIQVAVRHRFYANGLLVSNCMGNYHPHGDSAISGAIETMIHQNTSLIQGTGNWGGLLDPAAAPRYTLCQLSNFGWSCFDPDYLAVTKFVPNYDGKDKEPVSLPVSLPVVLLNGSDGIGVGVTTKLPTFTAESVIKILSQLFSGEKLSYALLASTLKPALKWGGRFVNSNQNKEQWLQLMKTGRAVVQYNSPLEVDAKKKQIIISEWPPGLSPDKFLEKVRALPQCARAYNSKGSTTFTVECRREYNGVQFEEFVQKVEEMTLVRQSYRMNVTHRTAKMEDGITTFDTEFLSLGVGELIVRWAKERLQLENNYLVHLIEKQTRAVNYSKLLLYACKNLKVVFEALKQNDPDTYLVSNLEITEEEAKQILELRVRQLSKLDQTALREKLKGQLEVLKELKLKKKNPKPSIIKNLAQTLELVKKDRAVNEKRSTATFKVR